MQRADSRGRAGQVSVGPATARARSCRPRIEGAGDQALLVRYGDAIDEAVNERVLALAAAIEADQPDWLVDWVPAYASLLVVFAPLAVAPTEVRAWLARRAAAAAPGSVTARHLLVPVWYDPRVGPDLETVAERAGLTVAEVIARHSTVEYRTFCLGFKPGFPYLGTLDERLACERLPAPRTEVPAGSVAIAGRQTGIYPVTSPGGWRILGRTPLAVFELGRQDPFLVHAGDLVRFVPVDGDRFHALERDPHVWELNG